MAATSHDESRSAYTSVHADRTGRSDGPHRDYIRHQILHQHLENTLVRQASASTNSNVSQSLALSSILRSGDSVAHHEDVRMAGGLSPDDLTNMTPVSLSNLKLQPTLLRNLENELKNTLLAVAEYYAPEGVGADAEGDGDDDPLQSASQLPERIRHQRAALTQQHTALHAHRAHVLQLVEQINAAQPALESQLVTALETLPPHLRATRTAQADVLAATVEAALLKLSLVRARAHRALYSFPPPSPSHTHKPAKTVGDAVTAAHGALRARAAAQDAEMGALDGQIAAYEGMLGLVEGGRGREGAFAQVVRDMARVKRETEECRRELMRLGWTGD